MNKVNAYTRDAAFYKGRISHFPVWLCEFNVISDMASGVSSVVHPLSFADKHLGMKARCSDVKSYLQFICK